MRAAGRVAIAIAIAGGAAIGIWLAVSGGGRSAVSTDDVITGRADEQRRRAEVWAARDRAEAEANRAKRLAAIPAVLGQRPGQPGPLFAGVPFDYEKPVPADARDRIGDFDIATDGHIVVFGNSFPGVSVDFGSDDGVVDAITRAWGPIPASGTWIDLPDRVTATLFHDGGNASISWEAFETVDDLIKPDDPVRLGFEPRPLVGAPQDAARAILHAGDYVDDHELITTIAPLGDSNQHVEVTFELDAGSVKEMRILTHAPQAAAAVRAALARKYGAPDGPWHRGVHTITITTDPDGALTIHVERPTRPL